MNSTPARPRLAPLAWWAIALSAATLALAHAHVTVTGPDAERLTFDSAEYALAGRAWLETGRLVTPFVYPAALGSAPGPPFPLLAARPLVPALDALAFAIAGPTENASLLPALLAFVACVLLVARLALGLSGSRAAALGAAAAFAVSPWALGFACDGRTEMPFAALLTAALVLLWELPLAPRPVAFGIVLGLAHLARPVLLPILPAMALGFWLLAPRGERARLGLRVLAGFLPLALLNFVYTWAAAGDPFAGTGSYLLLNRITPEWQLSRLNRMTPPPDAIAWVRANPGRFAEKIAHNLRSLAYGTYVSAGRWPAALALLAVAFALVRGGRAAPARRDRAFAITLVAIPALLLPFVAATVADARMLFPLLPTGVAVAFAGVARAAGRLGRHRRPALALAAALAVLAGAVPLAHHWRALRFGDPRALEGLSAHEWRGLGAALAPLLPGEPLVASDAGPWLAWHVHRAVTLVPLEPDSLLTGPVRLRPEVVVLTNAGLIRDPLEGAWLALFERDQPPAGFRFAGRVRSGRLEAAVFTRSASP